MPEIAETSTNVPALVDHDALDQPSTPSLSDRLRYAEALAQSGLLPGAYRGRSANVLVAIETGYMLGIAPMAALHNIHIVEGKPTYSAALMAALVRKAGHRLRVRLVDEHTAVAELVRTDDPTFTYRATWTTQRAKEAGLLGKDVWKRYRPNMLKNRAVAEVIRDAAQDVFLGPVYTPEELGSIVDIDGDVVHHAAIPSGSSNSAAVEEIDWEQLLADAKGDVEELRKLHKRAYNAGQPDEYLERIHQAGKEASTSASAPVDDGGVTDNEVVDAEVVDEDQADPAGDPPLCQGTAQDAETMGAMVTTTGNGREIGLCEVCNQWADLQGGHFLPHGNPDGDADLAVEPTAS